MRRKRWVLLTAGLLFLAILPFAGTSVEAYRTVTYVSETTGSMYGYHLWPGGLRTAAWSRTSPLESYLASHLDRPVEQRWSRCSDMGTTISGKHTSFADGPVGGMVRLRTADLQSWIDHHSQGEVVALYEFMRTAQPEASSRRANGILDEVRTY